MANTERYDRRVERTRNAIISAFKEMIVEKEFKEITIKELAERANINRKTFYLHYESMEEILFDLTLEISDLLFDILNEKGFFTSGQFDVSILVDAIDTLINSNYDLTKKLVSANSYRFFTRNIKDLVKESFIRKVKNRVNVSSHIMNLTGDYIALGVSKVLKDWFEDPQGMSSTDIAKLASSLIYGSIKGSIEFSNIQQNKS